MKTKPTWNSALLSPLAVVISLGPLCHLLGSQFFLLRRCTATRYSLPETSSFWPHRVIGGKGREVASVPSHTASEIEDVAKIHGVAQ